MKDLFGKYTLVPHCVILHYHLTVLAALAFRAGSESGCNRGRSGGKALYDRDIVE